MNLPDLNMSGWSILDYELALEGVRHVNNATVFLQNQPRSSASDLAYRPGADFIVQLGEGWCSDVLDRIVNSLRAIRFPDAKHDERRIMLLLQHETQWGSACSPLAEVLAMVERQRRPAVAHAFG